MVYTSMKRIETVAVIMAAAIVISGCSKVVEPMSTDVVGNGNTAGITTDVTGSAVTETTESEPVESNSSGTTSTEATSTEAASTDTAFTDTASPDAAVEGSTPVAKHGELGVNGTQLVDKNGEAYQLQGVSTHGIGWFPAYVNKDAFLTLRDEWGANCVRLAMYTDENNGYCSGGNKTNLKNIVQNGVTYATELGMYVIIDWHILHDSDPTTNQSEAITFFDEMSLQYADHDNVIYEICNEPNGGTGWSTIKAYAEAVIPVIKANNPDAIIIVGTPTWSQDVDQAAADPITGYSNIMYTLHFYADTHKNGLRQKMEKAITAGLPIFVTEFGITDASGNGNVNTSEGDKWIEALDSNDVSYCIWNLSNKNESSALLLPSCSKTSGWTYDDLSAQGQWYLGILGGRAID